MKLSILIPTIQSRQKQFQELYNKLTGQIADTSLSSEVEVLYLSDNGERSIGSKRNILIDMAQGTFIAFVDDDDDISDDYVDLIYHAIKVNPDIDCIGIKGIVTFRKKRARYFIHSIRYKKYFSKGNTYFRPPYHLNPVRREIAQKYKFEDINSREDIDWAIRMSESNELKKEYFIDKVIYFYYSRRPWMFQALIDLSEPVRHTLGLQLVNLVRIKRWLRPG